MVQKKEIFYLFLTRGAQHERNKSVGNPNGGTQLFLQIFLAPERVLAYFSTTIFISNFRNTLSILREDL